MFTKRLPQMVCHLLVLSLFACSAPPAASTTLPPTSALAYESPEPEDESYATAEAITPIPIPTPQPLRSGYFEGPDVAFWINDDGSITDFRLTACAQQFTNENTWYLVYDSESGKWATKAAGRVGEGTVSLLVAGTVAQGIYDLSCGGRGEWYANLIPYPTPTPDRSIKAGHYAGTDPTPSVSLLLVPIESGNPLSYAVKDFTITLEFDGSTCTIGPLPEMDFTATYNNDGFAKGEFEGTWTAKGQTDPDNYIRVEFVGDMAWGVYSLQQCNGIKSEGLYGGNWSANWVSP